MGGWRLRWENSSIQTSKMKKSMSVLQRSGDRIKGDLFIEGIEVRNRS